MILSFLLEFLDILVVGELALIKVRSSNIFSLFVLDSISRRLIIKIFGHGVFHLDVFIPCVAFGVFVESGINIFFLLSGRLSCVIIVCEFIISSIVRACISV